MTASSAAAPIDATPRHIQVELIRAVAGARFPRHALPEIAHRFHLTLQVVQRIVERAGYPDTERMLAKARELEEAAHRPPPGEAPSNDDAVDELPAEGRLATVRVGDVHPDPDNPRDRLEGIEELAESITGVGLLQPIVVRRHAGRLVILAGHRRHAALKLLGWSEVPVIIKPDMAPDHVLAAMLVENGQRAGLDPIEEARALKRLETDHGTRTHTQLASLIGRTQVHVSGRLALLDLPPADQDAIRAGELNLGDGIRRGRLAAGKVRKPGSTGSPHLGVEHDLASKVRARCRRLNHKSRGRNSVGGVGCGECWESVIRADERQALHQHSARTSRCALCGQAHDPDRTEP
ncbi:ParB/RepB/Spo0J family partition protein [Nocardioides sp. SOB77]|uniref:ParB/RepB/Spo0J family partition protein n=1 Tax=Nocardioides oceani TaxID=3058369 RepID=A0ABT8FJ93_9ACTN|nr:ParB/RepB/Spo0J family partition protein [Nocardioides oceani]MDN4174754.1 ParB/RepB/Spo0J family partition protein [Nocardioides oceani]